MRKLKDNFLDKHGYKKLKYKYLQAQDKKKDKIIQHGEVSFIANMEGLFNIFKIINVLNNINGFEEKE